MHEPRRSIASNRRLLIALIAILAILQAGILVYLWTLLRPAAPQEVTGSTPSLPLQVPPATALAPTGVEPTLATEEAPGVAVRIVVGLPVPATNTTALARAFDEERALEHVAYLAGDETEGRQPGTPGGRAASAYIAARFAEYGLQPGSLDNTAVLTRSYFQTFTLPYGRITQTPILAIVPPPGATLTRTYAYRTDYRALTGGYLGAGAGEGPVVWLNNCAHDDYAGLDLVGQIILCRYTRDVEVYRQAIEHRVGGLLLLERDRTGEQFIRGAYRETAWVDQTIPAYLISAAVAQDLLAGTDYTLDDLTLRFTATPLSTTVRMQVTTEELEQVEACNVLALLPGSDPEQRDQVVVIGAHYDHLGREPDGAIMAGANDDASGVAVVLEIARLWQAQGYRPARSVLFAAWDGEEHRLLGSQYYVQNPPLPFTRTVGMLALDMVGVGQDLQVDGEGATAAQLQTSARTYGITATLTSSGGSDHVPFLEASIPAALLIYQPDPVYHTPADGVENVRPENLKVAGVIAAHALAALAEGQVELERAVGRLQATIAAHDREAFLAGLDPTDPALRAAQVAWFDNLWSRELADVTIEPGRIRIGDGQADVTLRLSYRWADATRREPAVSYDVRFVQRDGVWAFAGYDLDTLTGDAGVTVSRFADVPVQVGELVSTTQRSYLAIAADLGLTPVSGTRVIYYPNAATLRAIARPAAGRDVRWLASSAGVPSAGSFRPAQSAGLAEIAWGQPVTPALVSLALSQMGLPPGAGAWLREGLALHYQRDAAREYLPLLAVTDVPTRLLDFPALDGLPEPEALVLRGQAWSATETLLARYGSAGLRALCAAWGGGRMGEEGAFQQALGLSAAQFESAWRAGWLDPLRADAAGIQATIAARVEAVRQGDLDGLLSTLVTADPVLSAEERNWFARLAGHTVVTYSVSGQVAAWSPGAREALVTLRAESARMYSSAITGAQPSRVVYDARFVRDGGRWRYAGVAWNELAGEHFTLKYQGHDVAWAGRVLDLAEAAYAQVTADLAAAPPLPQQIKVYDSGDLFRHAVSLTLPDGVTSWSAPGESIRLWLRADTPRDLTSTIARELARQVLAAQGVQAAWLREGVATYEAGRALPLGDYWVAGRYAPLVQDAVRRHEEFPLYDLPSWEDVPAKQVPLLQAQSWSLVSFVVERHGLAGLRRLIARSVTSADVAAGLPAALGEEAESFAAAWLEYARTAGVPDGMLPLAQRFDPARALAHVTVLASPEFGGREAGAPGADLAAAYIAQQFAALGLQPLGDPLTATESSPAGYLQRFPISYTQLIQVPTLTLLSGDGTLLQDFAYRQDFVESAGEGVVQADLVWVHTQDLEGLRFGGAVVLERGVDDPFVRARELQEHGAGGLIVATERTAGQLQASHVRPISGTAATIPVFEISEAAFQALLERLGLQYRDLSFAPPALVLNAQVQQTLVRLPLTTTLTANVLGLLPGSDPGLADELLIVGAHYDHAGGLPEGIADVPVRYFPGANRNASGVGALLELARVWQATNYRPARSVLFAAWGAEELGSAGVAHYVAQPAVPLTQTVAVIALDSIGNGQGYSLMYYGTPQHDLPLVYMLEAGSAQMPRRAFRRTATGEGWHVLFNAAGIPTAKLMWDGAEQDLYLPTDTPERIDPERLGFSGQMLTLVASWLAGC